MLAALWFSPVLVQTCIAQPCMDADLLLRNGHIVTMDGARSVASAMAVRDGKILAVGADNALAGCVSSRTQLLDLNQHTVLPGLIDVHTHAIEWVKSILRGEIDAGYPAVHAISEIKQAVAQRAATLPRGEWIVGSGWDDSKLAEHRYINRGDLDAVSLDHPVYLKHATRQENPPES
jgi:predicted amidohydrolase YtcJ